MKREKPLKAEDILGGKAPEAEKADARQKKLAGQIRAVIESSGREKIPAEEKKVLWEHIKQDLPEHPRRHTRTLFLKIAASLAFLLAAAAGWWLYDRHDRDSGSAMQQMEQVAQQAQADEQSGEIQLITPEASVAEDTEQAYNTLVVPYGNRAKLILPDSSKVWVNAGSKLVYPVHFSEKERQVYLEGEAYFSVRHDPAPFYVQTSDMQIRVMGTEFNVSAYTDDEKSRVLLVSGSIELTANKKAVRNKLKKRLIPNEIAEYDPAEKQLKVNMMKKAGDDVTWLNDYITFENTPLKEVLKKLERYYKVEILLEDPELGMETFSGPLDLQQDIHEIMELIKAMTSLNYEQTGERRILLKE